MPILVVLLAGDEQDISLSGGTIARLAQLGVNTVSVARDDRTVGVILEGWAFDPQASARAAADLIGSDRSIAATLHQVMRMTVAPAGFDPSTGVGEKRRTA